MVLVKRVASVAFFLLAVGGCGSGSSDDDDNGVDAAAGTIDAAGGGGTDAFVAPADSYTIEWGPLTVQPGEDTMCVTKRVGNQGVAHIGTIHNVLGATSHHFIVYVVSDTIEQPDPQPCFPFTDTLDPDKGAPLMITQKREEVLTLPEGVAFTLEDNQMVRLEMHFLNATESPQMASASTTLVPIPDAEFENEADFLFIGDVDIDLPAGATVTEGPTFFPLPATYDGVSFFGITGHTHKLGTDVTIATAATAGGEDTHLYGGDGTFVWSEPATTRFDPGFQIPAGGGFRFSCTWENTTGNHVGFGEATTDEMCFFWTYYYPSHGHQVCFQTDNFGGQTLCCPGSPFCDQLFGG